MANITGTKIQIPKGTDTMVYDLELYGTTLDYNATNGVLNLKNQKGATLATIDFVLPRILESAEMVNTNGTTAGKYLKLTFNSESGAETVYVDMAALVDSYTLPTATSTAKGGMEIFSDTVQSVAANSVTATASRTYGVQLNSAGQAVVNVPWTDNNTTYTASTGLSLSGTAFSLAKATATAIGGGSVGSVLAAAQSVTSTTTAGRYYNVDIDSNGKFVVNIPWTDTTYSVATASANGLMSAADKTKLDSLANYSLSAATSSALGGVKLFSDTAQSVAANAVSATASRTYGVQANSSGQLVVNVPWTDNNTTYSAMTAADATTGTSTTSMLISPKVLQDKITAVTGAEISIVLTAADGTNSTLKVRGSVS